MVAKILALILCVGTIACSLLAMRQSRLQAASEMAQAQLRIQRADERLWLMRSQVAAGVSPANVERLARALGPLKPIVDPAPSAVATGPAPTITPTEAPKVVPPPPGGTTASGNRNRRPAPPPKRAEAPKLARRGGL